MTIATRRAPLLFTPLLVLVVACGGGSSSTGSTAVSTDAEPHLFGEVAPATGNASLASPRDEEPISGFVFTNQGTHDVAVSDIVVTLASGAVIRGAAGVGVNGGSSVTFLFDSSATHEVANLSFVVDGSTEKLTVAGTDATGVVPGPSTGAQPTPAPGR